MDFYDALDQALDLLHQRGRVTYNALKRQFGLDDACLQDLKDEIIEAQRVAVDENDRVLVWVGDMAVTSPPAASTALVRARAPDTAPLAYTPAHLAEKIATARPTLAGERKQVTVLFADLKDSTELIRGLDPEAAQQLLDPALHHMMDAVHRFEGTVNQVLGDGIMALFGAPIAHEDHALRACYAALAMQTAMRAYTEDVRRTQALALADELGMRPLVAHCHHGLGRLYCQTGRYQPARAALSAAIALYRAMDMTFWLPQAEAVLARTSMVSS